MKFQRTPTTLNVQLEGPIGETTPLFNLPLKDLKEIVLDFAKMTTINSIGIKQWITWTYKIPSDAKVRMLNCPFVIATQASMVVGFVKPNMVIESIRLPFVCTECEAESIYEAKVGTDYTYAKAGVPAVIQVPTENQCPKCQKKTSEPDFLLEKTFKFLDFTS